MKKWQTFVYCFSVLIVVSLFLPYAGVQQAAAQKPIELRLAHMFPVAAPLHKHIEAWAKKIAADSNNRLSIRIFPSNTLIPPPQLYDGAAKGTADITYGFRYLPTKYTLGVTFPFVLGAPDVVSAGKIYDDIWKKYPEIMEKEWDDVKILWLAPTMAQHISTKVPVRKLEDMKGLQIRVPSRELSDLMKDLGASPVSMSTADFVVGMEKGTVDGGVVQPAAIHDNKLGGKIKYVLDVSLGVPTPNMVIMNKDSYNKLPPDLQSVIDKSCEFGKKGSIQLWIDAYDEAMDYFKTTGVEVIRLSPQEKARWTPIIKAARERVGKDLDKKGYPGTEIIQLINDKIEEYAP